jgi:hypothetical protein
LINLNKKYEKLKFLNKFNTLILQKVKYSAPLFILLMLGMLTFWYKTSQIETDVFCEFDTSTCTLLGNAEEFSLSVSPFPIKTEERLIFTLNLESGLKFESAWIQGINMYMGKIPVLPTEHMVHEGTSLQLESYLGSCSEPDMRWQMIVTLSDSSGNRFSRYVNFSSTTRY